MTGGGTEVPRTSRGEGDGGLTSRLATPGCGSGAGAALMMSTLLLMALKRRRNG